MKDYFKKYLKYKKKYLKLIGGANESVGFEYTTKIKELEDKGIFYEAEMDTIYNRNDDISLDYYMGINRALEEARVLERYRYLIATGKKTVEEQNELDQLEKTYKYLEDLFTKDIGFLLLRIKSNGGECFDLTIATNDGPFGLPKWSSFYNPEHEYGLAPPLKKFISELEKILKIDKLNEVGTQKLENFRNSTKITLDKTLKELMDAIGNTDDKTKKRFYRYLFFYKASEYKASEYKASVEYQRGGADNVEQESSTDFILNELFQELLFYLNGFIDYEQQSREIIYIIIAGGNIFIIFAQLFYYFYEYLNKYTNIGKTLEQALQIKEKIPRQIEVSNFLNECVWLDKNDTLNDDENYLKFREICDFLEKLINNIPYDRIDTFYHILNFYNDNKNIIKILAKKAKYSDFDYNTSKTGVLKRFYGGAPGAVDLSVLKRTRKQTQKFTPGPQNRTEARKQSKKKTNKKKTEEKKTKQKNLQKSKKKMTQQEKLLSYFKEEAEEISKYLKNIKDCDITISSYNKLIAMFKKKYKEAQNLPKILKTPCDIDCLSVNNYINSLGLTRETLWPQMVQMHMDVDIDIETLEKKINNLKNTNDEDKENNEKLYLEMCKLYIKLLLKKKERIENNTSLNVLISVATFKYENNLKTNTRGIIEFLHTTSRELNMCIKDFLKEEDPENLKDIKQDKLKFIVNKNNSLFVRLGGHILKTYKNLPIIKKIMKNLNAIRNKETKSTKIKFVFSPDKEELHKDITLHISSLLNGEKIEGNGQISTMVVHMDEHSIFDDLDKNSISIASMRELEKEFNET